MQDFIFNPQHV